MVAVPADASRPNTFAAPAKVNHFLHVVGRRADGYHAIQSAMQLIDLSDTLTISVRDDGRIVRDGDVPGVPEASDLMVRAARLLRDESGGSFGATLAVEKRIPMGGGLGGGSSDAATTLLVLNRLWCLDWSRSRLCALGLRLGADVPFFLFGGSAFVEGIGEAMTPVTLPDAQLAVVHPGVAVPTPAVFGAPELTRDSEIIKISDFSKKASDAVYGQSPADGFFRNDLEPVAARRFAAVHEALAWLGAGRRDRDGGTRTGDWPGARGAARMSGSGACVFRAFDTAEHATACIEALPAAWAGWSVRTLARHPLADFAG